MIEKAVTLLPEPDSPTIASVSPAMTSKEIPLTTGVKDEPVKKDVWRLLTESTGIAVAANLSCPDAPG
jgi:hypothetical protein